MGTQLVLGALSIPATLGVSTWGRVRVITYGRVRVSCCGVQYLQEAEQVVRWLIPLRVHLCT